MSLVQAQPTPLQLTADSLSLQRDLSGYSLYPHPWQFHAGDDSRWASPAIDDRNWLPYRSGFAGADTPPGWKGIGWFRLHFTLDTPFVGQMMAFRIAHMGASDIYLDGQRIGGFGKVGHSLATETSYIPNNEPVAFRVDRPGDHVLAVRLSVFHRYLTRNARYGYREGFLSWIAPHHQMAQYVLTMDRNNSMNLVPGIGAGLFALFHVFLFLFYPPQKSNLYYGICLTFYSTASFCIYVDNIVIDPANQVPIFYLFYFLNIAYYASSVAFVYSVYYPKQPRRLWIFYGVATSLFLLIVFFPDWQTGKVWLWLAFFLVCILEFLRVIWLAMTRRQPGVWLIGVGILATAFVSFTASGNVFFLWHNNPFGQSLFIAVGFLVLPFCTSLYLAKAFARTSFSLEAQLRQVQELSKKTLAQKTEKLKLVAEQNEVLEQTVQERTGKIQQQADKLREIDATKSRFFTNLTHEFRTPLTLMLGPAEQVLAETQEPNTKQQVGLLQRNARRLLHLINQLLDLSKLEAGRMVLTTAPGDLVSLVKGALLSFESLAEQKQIALHVQADREQLPMAIDRDKLEQILYNLVGNALKFTPAGGSVSVALTRREDEPTAWAELVITDTGVGIPAVKLPYIFDRFYQVDESDTREREGTGIGLALTNELIDLYGGSIQVRSEENVGTTVTVRLPIHSVQLPAGTSEPILKPLDLPSTDALPPVTDQRANPADAPLVLLIEDNDEVRTFIRSSLQDQYRICEAANGQEGVRLAQEQVPDLVVTDLMMPKMDGYQVCATLKQDERTSHIPIVMLTAKADLDSRIEGLDTGADCYLAKPFHQRELLAQINTLIQNRRQLRERYRQLGVFGQLSPRLPSMEEVFLNRVRAVISGHIADEQFSVEMLSQEVGVSRMQLHRKLIALLNLSPGDLIRQIRLELAHDLLRNHVATVAEVAYQVGFGNPANFSTSFSRHFGYAPSEVRKQSTLSSTYKWAKNG